MIPWRNHNYTIALCYLSLSSGGTFVGSVPGFKLKHIPAIVLVLLLGIVINSVLKRCINLISFWIEDSTPFQWLYDKLILVVGTIFPVEVFPKWAQPKQPTVRQ